MFKQIITAALAIVTTAVVGGQAVHADVTSDTAATTKGSITLTTGGAITLNQAPDLDFGQKPISTTATTYTTKGSAPIQVTNPGFTSGWSVSVAASKFTTGKYDLKGAELTVNVKNIAAADGSNTSASPDAPHNAIEPGGSAVNVFSAATDAGVGVWNNSWDTVILAVPAGNVAGDYKSELTWTLSDAPQ
ncbi:WxL domain-containing protein [Lacticaseibacillus porcinae]|uniref:WxL domain-containing protein n=1 Tax=Lacticaseibacillus porcinae TaxID=1123687 RepID=UPI000F7A33E3|nr:WxL domain-containing protein [Lacticaseibacillus porcinae]